ncbi:XTP/dITP diphosphatase [Candidatus Bathyarchaeota archaeon]|nr:XTP/dITP diphosphatase [Candidatus Bathyarchaeota archaeon]
MSRLDKPILFATSNVHKYQEVSEILLGYNITIKRADIKGFEIQSDSLKEIATVSVKRAVSLRGETAIVEDSGLFIDSLKGFPGPYSSYVFRTLGNSGIMQLMKGLDSRMACFKSVIVYLKQDSQPISFQGVALGRISEAPLGSEGFGFDPIFVPKEGDGRTFAQMSGEEKNSLSHRSKAARRFAEWYLSKR